MMAISTKWKARGKRGLSLFLALVMCISLVQITAFAVDDQVGPYQEYNDEGNPTGKDLTEDESVKTLEDGDLVMSKTIEQTDTDEFKIKLLVTTTENLEKIPLSQDAAVVLLIDASTSMAWDVDGHTTSDSAKKRITLAKDAAKNFVDSFGIDENGGKRMIAVGAYNGNAVTQIGWTDANDKDNGLTNRNALKTAIGNITLDGWTNPDAALQLANNLYGQNAVKDIASRFVILLTDGQPNTYKSGNGTADFVGGNMNDWYDTPKESAEKAAATASSLKNGRTVTLYTLAFAAAGLECYEADSCVNCGQRKSNHAWVTLCENCMQAESAHTELCKNCKQPKDAHTRVSAAFGYKYYCSGKKTQYEGNKYCPGQTDRTYDGEYFRVCPTGGTLYSDKVTVGTWLESIASQGCYKNAANGESIGISFDEISQTIKKLMQAWLVEDPLGEYISFKDAEGLAKSNKNITITRDSDGNPTGFNWSLWDEEAVPNKVSEEKTTYTYTLTYSVKLDTSAVGFQETKIVTPEGSEETHEEPVFHPTNGQTKLVYTKNALNPDGTLNTNPTLDNAYFNVPTVKGTIPSYDYTIEFYKKDKDPESNEYIKQSGSISGTAKLHTTVNGLAVVTDYLTKYDKYTFNQYASNTSVQITDTAAENVIRLCYDPVMTDVTVEHYYRDIITDADGETTTSEYKRGDQVISAVSALEDSYPISLYQQAGGVLYQTVDKVERVRKNPDGSETINKMSPVGDGYILSNLSEDVNQNLVRVYYTHTEDYREPASVTVTHHYTPKTWEFNSSLGKYEEVDGTTTDVVVGQFDDLKAPSQFSTELTPYEKQGVSYSDYSYVEDSVTGSNSSTVVEDLEKHIATMILKPGENTMSLDFTKPASNEPAEATVNVIYQYNYDVTTVNADGSLDHQTGTIYKNQNATPLPAHAGDLYSAYFEQDTNDGENDYTYTADSGNAARLAQSLNEGFNEITLVYTYTSAPTENATVTVNHIYGTVTVVTETVYEKQEVPVLDEEGNPTGETEIVEVAVGTKPRNVFTEDEKTVSNYPEDGAALYVGQSFTAPLQAKGDYQYDADREYPESDDRTIEHLETSNEIDLYYVKDGGSVDDTAKADVTYQHIYTTHVTGVKDGVEATWDETKYGDETTDRDQTVGESYTVEPVEVYEGHEYDLTTDAASLTITVQKNNPAILVHYERDEDRRGDMVAFEANYTYNAYAMTVQQDKDGNYVAGYYEEPTVDYNTLTAQATGENYAGMKITLGTEGKSDLYPETVQNPGLVHFLSADAAENVFNFVYSSHTPIATKVNYTVNHHYTVIDADGDSRDLPVETTTGEKYLGETFATGADTKNGSFDFQHYTVDGGEEKNTATTYRVDQMSGDVTVDFYYVKDNSVSVTYSILHVYRGQDWDDPDLEVEKEVWQTKPGTSGKAGQIVTANPDCVEDQDGKPLYQIDSVSISNGKVGEYGMKLSASGENAIVIYYSRSYDSREATAAVVNHHYSVRDTYTDKVTEEGLVTERFTSYTNGSLDFDGTGIYIGNLFKATLQETYTTGSTTRTYPYSSSTPEDYTIGSLAKAEYDEDGNLVNNIIDIYYERTVSSDPGTPERPDRPDRPDRDDDDDDDPVIVIPDEQTPTTELPTDLPDEAVPTTDLPDEEVPLAAEPAKTGDNLIAWAMAAAVSGLGLVWLALAGRKRKDENAQ